MSKLKPTDVTLFLEDLAGGVFAEQIANALSDVADCVVGTGKKGQVKVTFDISVLGDKEHRQVEVLHKLDFTAPETFGSRKEDYARKTPMYVNMGGNVSLFNQDVGSIFDHTGDKTKPQQTQPAVH